MNTFLKWTRLYTCHESAFVYQTLRRNSTIRGIAVDKLYCILSKALHRIIDKSLRCFTSTIDILSNDFIQHLEEKLTKFIILYSPQQ